MPIHKFCKVCKKKFSVLPYREKTANFCSRSCKAIFFIAGKNKQNIVNICKNCNKEYKTTLGEKHRTKFCCRLCQNRYQSFQTKITGRFTGEKNPRYKGGIQTYRAFAKANIPQICNRCSSIKNLIVHHKDENRYNNKIENLEIICRSCHHKHHKTHLNFSSSQQLPLSET